MRTITAVLTLTVACLLSSGCGNSSSASDDSGSGRRDDTPVFSTTSEEPILLRYKLKPGQVLRMSIDVDMTMRINQGGKREEIRIAFQIDSQADVTRVDPSGVMFADTKITRMKMTNNYPKRME